MILLSMGGFLFFFGYMGFFILILTFLFVTIPKNLRKKDFKSERQIMLDLKRADKYEDWLNRNLGWIFLLIIASFFTILIMLGIIK